MAQPFDNINYIYSADIPGNIQKRFTYNADLGVEYAGHAVQGLATSDGKWTVQKFTYDVNKQVTLIQTAYGVWDDRASLNYS
jgi:hypothetical protein